MQIEISLQERFLGAMLGLAVGDAVGTTLEFREPGSFEPIDDMVGGGPFHLKPGQWTDDTSMALCLASSLVENGWDLHDQMTRYLKWFRHGYHSSIGKCFDIGNTVREALDRFEITANPLSGNTHPQSAGNGSLMRLAPVPLYYFNTPGVAIEQAALCSRTTHGAQTAVDACRFYAGLIVGALQGESKATILASHYAPVADYWIQDPLCDEIQHIASGSYKQKQPPDIKGTGYVVASLEAALWCFYTTDNYRDAILRASNLGHDADTTAAICGQLAGAYYGVENMPAKWRNLLHGRHEIEQLSNAIYTHAMPGMDV